MLSHGSGEPKMSHPDYEQQAHHHSCLLVLIRGIGTAKPRSLQRVFERIQQVNNVKIKGGPHSDPDRSLIRSKNNSEIIHLDLHFRFQWNKS